MNSNAPELLHAAEAVGGAFIASCCFLAWASMGRATRHCFRAVYGAMGVAGLGLALLPFSPAHTGLRGWIHAALVVAVAAYLYLDRRRIDRVRVTTGGPS